MYNHLAVGDMLQAVVPISRFNKGEANKIFDEVDSAGCKIVFKNNKPTCVLLSPERYTEIIETLEDYVLFAETERRLNCTESSNTVSHDMLMAEFGITEADLDAIEVEIG